MSSRSTRRGTLASIAAEIGVSRTTVSNAYNRPNQLSPELRERILSTAERVGYPGPDPTARSLRMQRTGAIGVLLTEDMTYAFEDQASVEFMAGVAAACGNLDSSMLLLPAGVEATKDKPSAAQGDHPEENLEAAETAAAKAAQLVNQASVDGFIVYSVAADDPYLEAVLGRGLPTVICDQPTKPAVKGHFGFVGIDDRAAIKPAAQSIVDAGHSRIGILCIRLDRTPNDGIVSAERLRNAQMHVQRSRVQGVLDIVSDAALDPTQVPVVERHINNRATAKDAARELLTTHPELTAVVCTTDSMALGVLEYAREQGIKVPEELSITGFDGIPEALQEGITTVRQPTQLKGRESGEMLRELQQSQGGTSHRTPSSEVILETTFKPGTSVAPPAEGDNRA